MPGRVHERRYGERGDARMQEPRGKLAGGGDVVAQGQWITSTHGCEEDVVVSPEHALGHAGRAARVDAVEVVAAARGELASFGRRCEGSLVVPTHGRAMTDGLGHLQEGPGLGHGAQSTLHRWGEAAMKNEAHQRGVPVQVLQFARQVAVVDVDRHGTNLEARQHALDVFGAVDQLQPHRVTGTYAGAL